MNKHTVTIKNITIGGGRSVIAIPLVARDEKALRDVLSEAREAEADLWEYRADYDEEALADEGALVERLQLVREYAFQTPVLFTIRTAKEGGQADISYEQYRQINLTAAASQLVDLVDVELFTAGDDAASLTAKLHAAGVPVIGSSHDFTKTPDTEEMMRRVNRMQMVGMDITKLAVMPQSRRDVLRLMDAALTIDETVADRPCVTMSMGKTGMLSRMSGSLTGSAITFASAGEASAPGQIPVGVLRRTLKILEQ